MNNSKLSKFLTFLALIIGVVGLVMYIRVILAGDEALQDETALDLQRSIITPFVWATIIILGATVAASILSSILSLIKKPEQLKKTLLSLVVLGVVLVISYFMHDGSEVLNAQGDVIEGGALDATSNVWSSTGIWFSVILGGIGLAMFLVDMVKSIVKS